MKTILPVIALVLLSGCTQRTVEIETQHNDKVITSVVCLRNNNGVEFLCNSNVLDAKDGKQYRIVTTARCKDTQVVIYTYIEEAFGAKRAESALNFDLADKLPITTTNNEFTVTVKDIVPAKELNQTLVPAKVEASPK